MKTHMMVGIAACGLLSLPSLTFSQDQPVTGDKSVVFPENYKCSTNSPCRNITGEILRIEESYWVQAPGGGETHVRVTRETKMEDVPKVGDKIAAQLSSNGDANAIVKLRQIPKPLELPVPAHAQKDFRENTQGQAPRRQSEAETSGKMQSIDPLSGGGNIDPSSKMDETTR